MGRDLPPIAPHQSSQEIGGFSGKAPPVSPSCLTRSPLVMEQAAGRCPATGQASQRGGTTGWQAPCALSSAHVAVPWHLTSCFPKLVRSGCGSQCRTQDQLAEHPCPTPWPQGRGELAHGAPGPWSHPSGSMQLPRVRHSLNLWDGVCGQEGSTQGEGREHHVQLHVVALPMGLIPLRSVREGTVVGWGQSWQDGGGNSPLGIKQAMVCCLKLASTTQGPQSQEGNHI